MGADEVRLASHSSCLGCLPHRRVDKSIYVDSPLSLRFFCIFYGPSATIQVLKGVLGPVEHGLVEVCELSRVAFV